jgi:hypothetical protein
MDRAADYRSIPWNEAPRYLIRDRDGIHGPIVRRRLRAVGIRDKPFRQDRRGRIVLPND